ncbi:MAG: endonuclease domain-containing protein [Hyphomicrobium sp.]
MNEPLIPLGVCLGCGKEKALKSKGVCNSCYVQFRRTGSYTRERQPRGMCTVSGCDKPAHGKGLCYMHARRMKVSGSLDDPRADNYNLKSNHELYSLWTSYQRKDAYPIVPEWKADFFVFAAGVGKRPSSAHRLYRVHKALPLGPGNFEWRERLVVRHANETEAEYNQRHRFARRAKHGTAAWDSDLKFKYGKDFSHKKLLEMAEAQNHLCAISGEPETIIRNGSPQHLTVDHIKGTFIIRQLITTMCNTGIGMFNHDIALMAKAILYLAKHDRNGEGQQKIDAAIAYLQRHPVASLGKEGILPQD